MSSIVWQPAYLIRQTLPDAVIVNTTAGSRNPACAIATWDAGADRWDAVQQIALSMQAEIFVDALDRFVIADIPDVSTAAVVCAIAEGEGGTLMSAARAMSRTAVSTPLWRAGKTRRLEERPSAPLRMTRPPPARHDGAAHSDTCRDTSRRRSGQLPERARPPRTTPCSTPRPGMCSYPLPPFRTPHWRPATASASRTPAARSWPSPSPSASPDGGGFVLGDAPRRKGGDAVPPGQSLSEAVHRVASRAVEEEAGGWLIAAVAAVNAGRTVVITDCPRTRRSRAPTEVVFRPSGGRHGDGGFQARRELASDCRNRVVRSQ
ncbi:hypothetical protein SMICM17S_07166 [Streptomyces microflavus]